MAGSLRGRLSRLVFNLYAVFALAYLGVFAYAMVEFDPPFYTFVIFATEIFSVLYGLGTIFQIVSRYRPLAPVTVKNPVPRPASVDVLICTYNESMSLVRHTVRCALGLAAPAGVRVSVYLLDDGNRPAARDLARELGCEYLTRPSNAHYKAGNLNAALKLTDGEIVIVVDADHMLNRDFIARTIDYFCDPAVGFVQTPQEYYNIDSFQHVFDSKRGRLWSDGQMFHHVVQPAANRWNAAFFVGTGAALRRSALDAIGGFATETVTEDLHTSIRFHRAGYRSVYVEEPLGYMLAPQSLHQFLTQRLRWGQGAMQVLRKENPLFLRELSWPQRLCYFKSILYWLQPWVLILIYPAGAVFLLTGESVFSNEAWPLFLLVPVRTIVTLLLFRILGGPLLTRPILEHCYQYLQGFTLLKCVARYFRPDGLAFQVTPKGREQARSLGWKFAAPHVTFLAINTVVFAVGARLALSATSVGDLASKLLSMAFSAYFIVLGALVTAFALRRPFAHTESSIPEFRLATLATGDGAALAARLVRSSQEAITLVVAGASPPVGAAVRVEIPREGAAHLQVSGAVTSIVKVKTVGIQAASAVRVTIDGATDQAVIDAFFDGAMVTAIAEVVAPLTSAWRNLPQTQRELSLTGEMFAHDLYYTEEVGIL